MSLTILTADELQNLEMRAANQLGADTLMKRAGAAAARPPPSHSPSSNAGRRPAARLMTIRT